MEISSGKNLKCEENVQLGVIPAREIAELKLTIGDNAFVRSGSVIYAGSVIGKNLETGHNVVIREENQIGDDFKLWSNSVVDYGCKIGNGVRVHTGVYICQYTVIEDEVFLAPGVVLANDLHPVCAKCMKGPVIRRGAKVGAGAVLLPGVEIGEGAVVGAGAVVTKSIPPRSVAAGNPARVVKQVSQLKCRAGKKEQPYDPAE